MTRLHEIRAPLTLAERIALLAGSLAFGVIAGLVGMGVV